MHNQIKIYGERNTNTNYMSELIRLNLKVKEISGTVPKSILTLQKCLPGNELIRDLYFRHTYNQNLGWKHSRVNSDRILKHNANLKEKIAVVSITKNPYSWLLSLHRRPYHQYYRNKPDFESFLTTPWKTLARDNTDRVVASPIALWNIKNLSYLQLEQSQALNLTTEEIFLDPKSVIEKISKIFSIQKSSDTFVDYQRSTKDSQKNGDYYRDYYLNEKWRDKISAEAISIINASIDRELMTHFGYKLL